MCSIFHHGHHADTSDLTKCLFRYWVLSICFIIDEKWLNVLVRNPACLDSYAITSAMRGCIINWEIYDSFSIRNTWKDSQSSFMRPLWLMHLLPVYNMYDHIARTHNIGSCIMYWSCLNMMMVKPAICISHAAGAAGFHFEWLGFERAQSECLESWLWLHLQALTPQIELTSLSYSLWCPVRLQKAFKTKKLNFFLSILYQTQQDSRDSYWYFVQMLKTKKIDFFLTRNHNLSFIVTK